MASPFPGMDPYLEGPSHWPDFHSRLINSLSEALADDLPQTYFACIEQEVVLVEPEAASKRARPDVLVGREPRRGAQGTAGGAAVAELEPSTLHNLEVLDPLTQSSIHILRLPGKEVVSVIEVLSPANKEGDTRGIYLEKRSRMLQRRINVVELDLLRAGQRLDLVEELPEGDYYAFVSRGERRPECQVYAWGIRQRLPVLPIPLKPPDADVQLDLAKAFTVAYERGRYERFVEYEGPAPEPALDDSTARWARDMVRSAGRK